MVFLGAALGCDCQCSTYDRFQRTHGMMQDIDNVVCDDPSKAHHLLSSILTLVQQLI
eukprot:COSAG06_NODE_45154_length_357_cov_0.775194_1_plen_56_part_01